MNCVYWLEQVDSVKGDDVVCKIKNSATLAGSMFTLHVCQVRIEMPTLSEKDKEVSDNSNRCIMNILLVCLWTGELLLALVNYIKFSSPFLKKNKQIRSNSGTASPTCLLSYCPHGVRTHKILSMLM